MYYVFINLPSNNLTPELFCPVSTITFFLLPFRPSVGISEDGSKNQESVHQSGLIVGTWTNYIWKN